MNEIKTVEQLNALPVGAVVRSNVECMDDLETVAEKVENWTGRVSWYATGQKQPLSDTDLSYLVPALILWEP